MHLSNTKVVILTIFCYSEGVLNCLIVGGVGRETAWVQILMLPFTSYVTLDMINNFLGIPTVTQWVKNLT